MCRHTYLFDSWFAHDSGLPQHIESYGKDWIGPLRSNRKVTYAGEDEENPVEYLATNKIDAPSEHAIRSYGMRWCIEMFFEDSKQDLGLGDCELQADEGASHHWHLLMAAYSLVRLGPESSTLERVRSKRWRLRANLEHPLKEAVYNLLSWVRENDDRGVDVMEEIDHLFVHSTADAKVQS